MTVRFSCTSFAGTNKKGILPPDENGYYLMPIGGLNVFNSAGMYYTYDAAKELFTSSSSLMRRIKRGALRGEVGHPKRGDNESMEDFVNRYLSIDDSNVCVQFCEIYLDFENYKDDLGNKIVCIMGKLIPSGVHGPMLQKQLNNPLENVCFSIRSLTKDYQQNGVIKRDLQNIVTFDLVNEPGISHATKYCSIAIENLYDNTLSKNQLVRAVQMPHSRLAMESAQLNAAELFKSLGWSLPGDQQPIISKW